MVRFCQTIGRGEAGGAGGKWASRQAPGVGEPGCRGKSSQQAPPSSVTLHLSLLNIFPLESPVGLYSGQWNSSAFSTEYHKRERSLWFIWKKSSRRTPLQAGEKKPHLGPGWPLTARSGPGDIDASRPSRASPRKRATGDQCRGLCAPEFGG